MKKYRLIKQYPGSDSLGTIITGNKETMYSKGLGFRNYDWAHVETNPEYWQEVKDYAYQIISFSSNRWGDRLATLDEDGRYTTTTGGLGWSLKELLEVGASVKSGDIKIHSVKRISDGEIFTIGNKAKTTGKDHSHTITSFRIKQYCIGKDTKGNYLYDGVDRIWVDWEDNCGGNWLEFTEKVIEKDYEVLISRVVPQEILSVKRLSDGEVFTVGDKVKVYEHGSIKTITEIAINDTKSLAKEGIWLRYDSGSSHMAHATKAKQPIFLTHDGKDIFDGDKLWYVNKRDFYKSYFIASKNQSFFSDTRAYFLTREDAEDYIKRNKVLFTTEDGVGIRKGDMIHGIYRTTNAISNTVVGFNNGVCDPFVAIFSTRAAAENYLVQKSHSLSIEDFWEFVSWGGSNVAKSKRLKRLVKERLNIE